MPCVGGSSCNPVDVVSFPFQLAEPCILALCEASDLLQELVVHFLVCEESCQEPSDIPVFQSEPLQPFRGQPPVEKSLDLFDEPLPEPCVQPDPDAFPDLLPCELWRQQDCVAQWRRRWRRVSRPCDFDGPDDSPGLREIRPRQQFRGSLPLEDLQQFPGRLPLQFPPERLVRRRASRA